MEMDPKVEPKYGPGDNVNIQVEIAKTVISKDAKTGKTFVSYQVYDSKEKSYLNSMSIKESAIQD